MLFFYDVTNKHLIEEIQRFLIKNEKKTGQNETVGLDLKIV